MRRKGTLKLRIMTKIRKILLIGRKKGLRKRRERARARKEAGKGRANQLKIFISKLRMMKISIFNKLKEKIAILWKMAPLMQMIWHAVYHLRVTIITHLNHSLLSTMKKLPKSIK